MFYMVMLWFIFIAILKIILQNLCTCFYVNFVCLLVLSSASWSATLTLIDAGEGRGAIILLHRRITFSQHLNIQWTRDQLKTRVCLLWSNRKKTECSICLGLTWCPDKVQEHLFPNSEIEIFDVFCGFSSKLSYTYLSPCKNKIYEIPLKSRF